MDLTEPLKPDAKPPWSPMGIAVLAFFLLPAGGILHGLNYGRLGKPLYRRFVLTRNLLSCGLLILFADLVPLQRGFGITISLFFASYFYKTQEQSFQEHRSQGGEKASFQLPILLSLAVLIMFGLLYVLPSVLPYMF